MSAGFSQDGMTGLMTPEEIRQHAEHVKEVALNHPAVRARLDEMQSTIDSLERELNDSTADTAKAYEKVRALSSDRDELVGVVRNLMEKVRDYAVEVDGDTPVSPLERRAEALLERISMQMHEAVAQDSKSPAAPIDCEALADVIFSEHAVVVDLNKVLINGQPEMASWGWTQCEGDCSTASGFDSKEAALRDAAAVFGMDISCYTKEGSPEMAALRLSLAVLQDMNRTDFSRRVFVEYMQEAGTSREDATFFAISCESVRRGDATGFYQDYVRSALPQYKDDDLVRQCTEFFRNRFEAHSSQYQNSGVKSDAEGFLRHLDFLCWMNQVAFFKTDLEEELIELGASEEMARKLAELDSVSKGDSVSFYAEASRVDGKEVCEKLFDSYLSQYGHAHDSRQAVKP